MERFESMLGIFSGDLEYYMIAKDNAVIRHIRSIVKYHGIASNEIATYMDIGRLEIIAVNVCESTVGIEILLDHNVIGKFSITDKVEYRDDGLAYRLEIDDYPFYKNSGPDHFGWHESHAVNIDPKRYRERDKYNFDSVIYDKTLESNNVIRKSDFVSKKLDAKSKDFINKLVVDTYESFMKRLKEEEKGEE